MTCDACQYDFQDSECFKFTNEYDIHFMWYPASFSQSRLGNKNSSKILNQVSSSIF